ncbi:MAG: hypothetical protein LH650_01565 [Chloroflexi bacterium]|nr:hypothetical protein [Chloroflexota bacterium]
MSGRTTRMRLAALGLLHETNTFSSHPTGVDDFLLKPVGVAQSSMVGIITGQQVWNVHAGAKTTRDGYPMGQGFIPLDTPGPAASNLSRFTYHHRRVPMLPWEPDATYDPQP